MCCFSGRCTQRPYIPLIFHRSPFTAHLSPLTVHFSKCW